MVRLSRVLSCLALAGCLTHCASASGAGGSSAEAAGALRFAWPEGMTLQVSTVNTTTEGDQPPEQSGLSYTVRLEGQGEERRLRFESLSPQGQGAAPAEGAPPPLPTLVLGPKGELRRVEGIDKTVQEVLQEAESQGIAQEQQEQIIGLVRHGLEQIAQTQWELLVGKWSGLALRPGASVERKGQTTVPLFGSPAATREKVTLKERAPCTEGAAEKRCVRLVLESSLDPEGLDAAMDALLRQLRATLKANMGLPDVAIPGMSVMKLRVDSTVEFIAEPETLVPHLQRSVTNSQVVLQEEGGERKDFENQRETVDVFTPVAR